MRFQVPRPNFFAESYSGSTRVSGTRCRCSIHRSATILMRLWLDDVRDPANFGCVGWTWAKTADEAIAHLFSGVVERASLDHDLTPAQTLPADGTIKTDGEKSGYDVVCWLEQNPQFWPTGGVEVHSQNPAGIQRMRQVVDKHYGRRA